jgi:hypothetical protein
MKLHVHVESEKVDLDAVHSSASELLISHWAAVQICTRIVTIWTEFPPEPVVHVTGLC